MIVHKLPSLLLELIYIDQSVGGLVVRPDPQVSLDPVEVV